MLWPTIPTLGQTLPALVLESAFFGAPPFHLIISPMIELCYSSQECSRSLFRSLHMFSRMLSRDTWSIHLCDAFSYSQKGIKTRANLFLLVITVSMYTASTLHWSLNLYGATQLINDPRKYALADAGSLHGIYTRAVVYQLTVAFNVSSWPWYFFTELKPPSARF